MLQTVKMFSSITQQKKTDNIDVFAKIDTDYLTNGTTSTEKKKSKNVNMINKTYLPVKKIQSTSRTF